MHIALCYILVCSEMKTHISRPISLICQKSLYTIILNRMCIHNRIVRHTTKYVTLSLCIQKKRVRMPARGDNPFLWFREAFVSGVQYTKLTSRPPPPPPPLLLLLLLLPGADKDILVSDVASVRHVFLISLSILAPDACHRSSSATKLQPSRTFDARVLRSS